MNDNDLYTKLCLVSSISGIWLISQFNRESVSILCCDTPVIVGSERYSSFPFVLRTTRSRVSVGSQEVL